ncbi:uncharacterized protein LOC124368004 [Homalodisca vitripennis]|uniref:uncharacterized protein LOC124368004 n=1 Tax=Homalodisca vitripennis TaxID=197043 RepID=UPI001EE9E1CA|nr:uncharacterized protein LOC124368004 [Homalodisca vitripennis]
MDALIVLQLIHNPGYRDQLPDTVSVSALHSSRSLWTRLSPWPVRGGWWSPSCWSWSSSPHCPRPRSQKEVVGREEDPARCSGSLGRIEVTGRRRRERPSSPRRKSQLRSLRRGGTEVLSVAAFGIVVGERPPPPQPRSFLWTLNRLSSQVTLDHQVIKR